MNESSITVWEGIDAIEAETRLRKLRRREAELQVALSHQEQIQKIHPNSFAVSLSRKGLEAKRRTIAAELAFVLKHRVNEPMAISLSGREFQDHSASAAKLGLFLLRLQKLYTAVAQAIQTGPTLRGPIASVIQEATELRLASVYSSSFGMELFVRSRLDLLGKSVSSDTLIKMFELFEAASNERKLMELSGALGTRAMNHFRRLATYLATSQSSMVVSWNDYTGIEHQWSASVDRSQLLLHNLRNITQISSEEQSVTGFLGGLNLFRGTFEIDDREHNRIIDGRVLPGLSAELAKYFGRMCNVTVDATEVLDRGSGDRRTYYVLTAVTGISGLGQSAQK